MPKAPRQLRWDRVRHLPQQGSLLAPVDTMGTLKRAEASELRFSGNPLNMPLDPECNIKTPHSICGTSSLWIWNKNKNSLSNAYFQIGKPDFQIKGFTHLAIAITLNGRNLMGSTLLRKVSLFLPIGRMFTLYCILYSLLTSGATLNHNTHSITFFLKVPKDISPYQS